MSGRANVQTMLGSRDAKMSKSLSLYCLAEFSSLIAQLVKNPPAMQETLVQFLGQEDPLERRQATHSSIPASLVAQLVKNRPAMQETWVQCLGWEDPLEKGKATHCSILAWRILLELYSLIQNYQNYTVHGVTKSWTRLSNFHFTSLCQKYFEEQVHGI